MSIILDTTSCEILKQLTTFKKDRFTNKIDVFTYPYQFKNKFKLPIGFCIEQGIVSQEPLSCVIDSQVENILRPEQKAFLLPNLIKSIPSAQGWDIKPGFGKTITCLVALKIYNMVSLIVVHRIDLKKQWETEIDKLNFGLSIKVVMISNLDKHDADVIVIDEAHACLTSKAIMVLATKTPKILIGLSGTFFRYDIRHKCLSWFFGEPLQLTSDVKQILNSSTTRQITLNIINTGIKLPESICPRQSGGWNKVLSYYMEHSGRNNIIINQVLNNIGKQILIIVRFVRHGQMIQQLLKQENIDCFCYFSNEKIEQVSNTSIIISTNKKIGTGISLNRLNCLILATDLVNYSFQCISRILRDGHQDAFIIDLVDDHPILKNHFGQRLKVYNSLGVITKKT